MSIKKNTSFISILLFSIVFMAVFYSQIIIHPNNFLFSNAGDGLKNYFTYAYYIKHGSNSFNFSGMNYPYGENVFYTDCHPIFSFLLKFFGNYSDVISNNSIGILNLILIGSIAFTFIIIYLLLKEIEINEWIAVLFSIGITLLAPQIFRLGGHLALSYSFAIPLSWLITLKIIKSNSKPKWVILLFLNNLFWLLVHAYLGVIICFFIFIIFLFLQLKKIKSPKFSYTILISIITPITLFYSFIKITDNHTDRTTNPSGFFGYYAEFDDVFVPHHKPLGPFLNKITGNIINLQWEAWSYVGVSTVFLVLFLLIYSILHLLKKSRYLFLKNIFKSNNITTSLLASMVLLLFAMAFPFIQFPSLLNYVPFLKQFRALGRFTWPFYFVATVFTAYVLNQAYLLNRSKKIVFIILIAGVLNTIEGIFYHIEVSKSILNTNDVFNKSKLSPSIKSSLNKINANLYQAILPLPFYHYGSESFSRPRQSNILKHSITISYQTGIPLIGASLTRLSIQESKNCIQLISPTFYEKEIKRDLPNHKPILIIVSNENLSHYEKDILKKGILIHKTNEIAFYSLSIDQLFADNSCDIYKKYAQNKSALFFNNGFYASKDSVFIFHNNFEHLNSKITHDGIGAIQSLKNHKTLLVEFKSNTFNDNKTYTSSFWIYNKTTDALNGYFKLFIDELDEYNNLVNQQSFLIEEAEVINKDWSMLKTSFKITNSKNKLKLYLYSNNPTIINVTIDDLLISEVDVDIFKYNQELRKLFYNNHIIKLNKLCVTQSLNY